MSETDAAFLSRILAEPNEDLLRLIRIARRETSLDDFNEAHERIYRQGHDADRDSSEKTDLAGILRMMDRWLPKALPANAKGQVHFARVIAECAADAIRDHLSSEGSAT